MTAALLIWASGVALAVAAAGLEWSPWLGIPAGLAAPAGMVAFVLIEEKRR